MLIVLSTIRKGRELRACRVEDGWQMMVSHGVDEVTLLDYLRRRRGDGIRRMRGGDVRQWMDSDGDSEIAIARYEGEELKR